MTIKTGYLYHIKDDFFKLINDKSMMINHKNGHSRPSYLAIEDNNILWFIPLSSKVDKYKPIIEVKRKKYGSCKTIMIKKIAGIEQVILIQNAFPTTYKYIKSIHTIEGRKIRVATAVEREIISNFKYLLSLKEKGLNLFFTDVDRIKSIIDKELKETSYVHN